MQKLSISEYTEILNIENGIDRKYKKYDTPMKRKCGKIIKKKTAIYKRKCGKMIKKKTAIYKRIGYSKFSLTLLSRSKNNVEL